MNVFWIIMGIVGLLATAGLAFYLMCFAAAPVGAVFTVIIGIAVSMTLFSAATPAVKGLDVHNVAQTIEHKYGAHAARGEAFLPDWPNSEIKSLVIDGPEGAQLCTVIVADTAETARVICEGGEYPLAK